MDDGFRDPADNTTMTKSEFKALMAEAEARCGISHRPHYCEGYVRGLRRLYHGPHFGNLQDHEEWLGWAWDERDKDKADRGRGYLDGLQGMRPQI